MRFLFSTEPDDGHAILVKLALEASGHDVRLLFTADQPTLLKNSIHIDNDAYIWKSADHRQSYTRNDYDVVWWRRARKPYIPDDYIHPRDNKFVKQENTLFYEAITYNMAPHAWWINNKDAAIRASSKLLQLRVAVNCGLRIPLTLCSNDPNEIRYFLLKHESEGVIYKPLCTPYWLEPENIRVFYTSQINFLGLPEDGVLQATPGIFQKEVKKKYELRVTCFGDFLMAARIESPEKNTDWRSTDQENLQVIPYTLPSILEEKIRLFMRKMGLVFGCIDLIINEKEEVIFLEVNEQGQFLWKENYHPSFKMLDIFVKFLLNQSPCFQWNDNKIIHHMQWYEDEARVLMNKNMSNHVSLNHIALNQGEPN